MVKNNVNGPSSVCISCDVCGGIQSVSIWFQRTFAKSAMLLVWVGYSSKFTKTDHPELVSLRNKYGRVVLFRSIQRGDRT
jgi:hypothetical protein